MAVMIIPHPEQKAIPSDDMPHFVATYHRALALCNDPHSDDPQVTIYLGKRGYASGSDEWLEHHIVVDLSEGRKMLVGAIERYIGAGSEFHS